jgi:hypothetical protein
MRGFVCFAVLTGLPTFAAADTLWDQPWDGHSAAAPAQQFTDFLMFTTTQFDDFVVGADGWTIDHVRIAGVDGGDPGSNQAVKLAFGLAPGFHVQFVTFDGVEAGGDLHFDLGGYYLAPGTYWISAWVKRPYCPPGWLKPPTLDGGWYGWLRTTPVTGGEECFHNPGGAFGYGLCPVPGSVVYDSSADQAFLIEGTIVPEPAGLLALSLGIVPLLRRR